MKLLLELLALDNKEFVIEKAKAENNKSKKEEKKKPAAKKEEKKPVATKPKAKKPGKPGDKHHDDGTDLQFKDDRPFMKKPKFAEIVGSNMWFNMTRSGKRAGDLE